jgi:hypothetical protein
MLSSRLKTIAVSAVFLVALCGIMVGNAYAQTDATEVEYAREVGEEDAEYTLPMNTVAREMGVLRSMGDSFVVTVALSDNAEFVSGVDRDDLSMTGTNYERASLPGGDVDDKDTEVEFLVEVIMTEVMFPTITINTMGWVIRDVDDVLGGGGSISISVSTRDAGSGIALDPGSESDTWLTSEFAVVTDDFVATTATIDVGTNRVNFVATISADSLTMDVGATLGIGKNDGPLNLNGTIYGLDADSDVILTISGNLIGIDNIHWGGEGGEGGEDVDIDDDAIDAGEAVITIAGNSGLFDGTARGFTITVDDETSLAPRTLTLTVDLDLDPDRTDTSGDGSSARELVSGTLTVWSLNGTILITNFINGNSNEFRGRVYLWNPPTSVAGVVTVRVFSLAIPGAATLNDSELLGTVELSDTLGPLGPGVALNIRLAEDILVPLGMNPYTDTGGNLVLEITVESHGVTGYSQTMANDLSLTFGTVPLSIIN